MLELLKVLELDFKTETMKNINYIATLLIAVMVLYGCKSKQSTAGNYSYKTECLWNSFEGSQTVKAWGSGRNKEEAIEKAKKQAVNDLLFNGIIEGKSVCDNRPIVGEVNARAKYKTYFNAFFASSAICANPAASLTAISANILRFTSIPAKLKPLINLE